MFSHRITHLLFRPLQFLLDLVSLRGVRRIPGATNTGEFRGAHVRYNACPAKHLGERAQPAFRIFQHPSNLVWTS